MEYFVLILGLSLFTQIRCKMEPIVLVHGGAGDIPDSRVSLKIAGVKKAASLGYKILKNGGSVVDAVEEAVKSMEDDEAFNAGYGSVLNLDGDVEMDASIMIGSNLNSGGVTVVKDIAHPISLARLVMEKTPHFLLAGEGANRFAKEQGILPVPPGSLVSKYAKEALEMFKKYGDNGTEMSGGGEVGTVGAVAIDSKGRLAAATSTGGITGKMVGRSSDTCIIGSGTYADDNVGAVSTTGHGESIARFCLAHSIIYEMRNGSSASEATTKALKEMKQRLPNTAGAITISKSGELGIDFTSRRMAWAYQVKDEMHFGIEHGQHTKEKIN
ncbi:isoaspartyl peptidase/L-asparaginase isoform X2 [Tribolium madens]|uniref:isoaspartyl peptidase/L-asparaginase isoform X2 n=1 Tax=Tribolium madens TaxID=41895 RepID=UPI001CF738E5|nr:isoaspartyl peptidase/L-asparaginase isoform X2 [Tribolium madens]